jgi:hypothetical protein
MCVCEMGESTCEGQSQQPNNTMKVEYENVKTKIKN